MKTLLKTVALALALWVGPAAAGGDEIAVIVNKGNPAGSLSQNDLRPIFQTTKTSWPDGSKITALNLPDADGTRKGFDAAVMGLDPDRVARYWVDRKIRGGNPPPKSVGSSGAVVKVVGSKAEAIGYVPSKDVSGNVKVVARIRGGQLVGP
jgi:ABC-type phosphate transport system substrate-binding protein